MAEKATVLVVEDDTDILDLVSMLLREEGYEVRAARSGAEALAALDGLAPRLILLDMKMPVMNGWQFMQALGQRRGPRPKVVVVTAAADAAETAREVGATAWIGKPFDIEELLRVVRAQTS